MTETDYKYMVSMCQFTKVQWEDSQSDWQPEDRQEFKRESRQNRADNLCLVVWPANKVSLLWSLPWYHSLSHNSLCLLFD